MFLIIFIVISYLIGSIPFGLIFTDLFLKQDVRKIGSGNVGATNVLRTGNKLLAFATLLLDIGKGAFAVYLCMAIFSKLAFSAEVIIDPLEGLIYGFFAIVGHCFPVWLKFKGGKGVATTFGVLFAAVPWAGLIAAVTWGIVAGFSRYSSLSAICAVAIAPLVTLLYYGAMPAGITALIAALVIWRHKDNIKRLSAGTEPKIGAAKDKDEPASTKH